MRVLNQAFDHPQESEEHAVAPLAGGILQHGFQCGMLWGSVLASGAQAYDLHGAGPEAETRAVLAAQRLVKTFRGQTDHINCSDITHIDKTSSTKDMIIQFLLRGGAIGCFRIAAKYGPSAFDDINSVLADENIDILEDPVSCSAILARQMGVSEEHVLMATGFAGGIGLSGGACGALGAAIWIIAMKMQADLDIKNLWGDKVFTQKIDELMERFLKITCYEFECSNIVGRNFENAGDHADFICKGGCSKLINELAAGC